MSGLMYKTCRTRLSGGLLLCQPLSSLIYSFNEEFNREFKENNSKQQTTEGISSCIASVLSAIADLGRTMPVSAKELKQSPYA
jgi:hypothetical protein